MSALLLGAALGGKTAGTFAGFLTAAGVLGALAAWRRERPGAHLSVLLAFLLGGFALARWAARTELPPELLFTPVRLEAEVEEVLEFPDGARLEVAVARVVDPEHAVRFRAFLYARRPFTAPFAGQRLLVETTLRPEQPAGNPGQADTFSPRVRRGLVAHGSFDPDRLVLLSPPPGWRPWLQRVHQGLADDVRALAPSSDAAALYLTLAAGLRSTLSPDLEEAFAESGLAHILSVSGLHVAALALMALAALRWLGVWLIRKRRDVDPRRPGALAALPIVWAYVIFTGWQPPAVRSAVMATAVLVGIGLRRRGDALNGLALAAMALVVLAPASLAGLSLQLSFLAVLSLVLVAPALRQAVPIAPPELHARTNWVYHALRAREALVQILCASVAVTLTTLPLVAGTFHRVSLAGLLANVIALPVSGVLTGLAAGGAALWLGSPWLATPVLWTGTVGSELLVRLAEALSGGPLASVFLPSFGPVATAAYLAGIFAFAVGVGRWRWLAAAVPVALVAVVVPTLVPRPGLEVTFLSVGHGDAVFLSSRGAHALVDGGGTPGGMDTARKYVVPFLRERGVRRLRLAALSHPHADHALGLASAIEQLPTERIWLPAGSGEDGLGYQVAMAGERWGAKVEAVTAGRDAFTLGEAQLDVLGPPEDRTLLEGINDRSTVLRVRHGAVTFLLPGDLEAAGEEVLDPGAVTVLKAAHHGSRTSSTPGLIARARPRFVVFCVGAFNRFGFPHAEVVDRYRRAGARCYRTDLHGAVTFRSDGTDVEVDTWHAPASSQATERGRSVAGQHPAAHRLPAMNLESIDLAGLVDDLRRSLPGGPVGYLRGKALMRDALVSRRGFSEYEAEELIDTLELNGYLHYLGDPSSRSVADAPWQLNPHL